MSIFDQASRKVTDTFKGLQRKTNESMAAKRIDSEIRAAEAEMQGLFAAIGQAAYAGGANLPGTEELFAGVAALKERIAASREALDKLNDVKRCPTCDARVQRHANFCPQCGEKLEEVSDDGPAQENCPGCGNPRKEGAPFCETCGRGFDAPAEPEGAEEAETPEEPEPGEDK